MVGLAAKENYNRAADCRRSFDCIASDWGGAEETRRHQARSRHRPAELFVIFLPVPTSEAEVAARLE